MPPRTRKFIIIYLALSAAHLFPHLCSPRFVFRQLLSLVRQLGAENERTRADVRSELVAEFEAAMAADRAEIREQKALLDTVKARVCCCGSCCVSGPTWSAAGLWWWCVCHQWSSVKALVLGRPLRQNGAEVRELKALLGTVRARPCSCCGSCGSGHSRSSELGFLSFRVQLGCSCGLCAAVGCVTGIFRPWTRHRCWGGHGGRQGGGTRAEGAAECGKGAAVLRWW